MSDSVSPAEAGPGPASHRSVDPGAVRPVVTVVIPCHGHVELTVRCIMSLRLFTGEGLYEVVVVDNASNDATSQLGELGGGDLVMIHNADNLGFGPACNQGAELSSGDLILFLNNDVVLMPGWLDPLVECMEADPFLGAVQPKLLYPDGTLADAGGAVFASGQPYVYGKHSPDPEAPTYACRRAPDYASGACLLVRRAAFEQVGGFDDRYAPCYFEDVDLSFALREAGWRVLYEPASSVVHEEGSTAGTDPSQGMKRYQVRNGPIFAAKWADALAERPDLGTAASDRGVVERWVHRAQGGYGPGEGRPGEPPPARRRADEQARQARSVVVFDAMMPVYDEAAGALRLFSLLRLMREEGHSVTFYALGGGDRRYARELGRFGITCFGGDLERREHPAYRASYFPDPVRLVTERRFDTVVFSTWPIAEAILPHLRGAAPGATFVVDSVDVEFRRLEAVSAMAASGEHGSVALRLEAPEVSRYREREMAVYAAADRVVFVTEEDRSAVCSELPTLRDTLIVPTAHEALDPGPGFDERAGLLLVGNFRHEPNLDALRWWHDEIGPLLAEMLPGVPLKVVGTDPGGKYAAPWAGEGIEVIGWVASTLPYLHSARLSVAPLRYGAGMKGKVGEALAAGLPVVGTPVAFEGMSLQHAQHVLVAATARAFAQTVAQAYFDRPLWERLRSAGRSYLLENFGTERMRHLVDAMVAPATPGPATSGPAT